MGYEDGDFRYEEINFSKKEGKSFNNEMDEVRKTIEENTPKPNPEESNSKEEPNQ